jgi:hypothetical protein
MKKAQAKRISPSPPRQPAIKNKVENFIWHGSR